MELVFGTLQSRLPAELRVAEIGTVEAANCYFKPQFVPEYNARFAVPAAEPGSAFIPNAGRPLEDVLCVQEDPQVARDNCVQWKGLSLQIPPQRHRHHSRQGDRARARISRRSPRRLRWAELPRALRPKPKASQCLTGRLNPLGAPGLWICGQRCRVVNNATGEATAEAGI